MRTAFTFLILFAVAAQAQFQRTVAFNGASVPVVASSGGVAFPSSIPNLYGRYYSGSWLGMANGSTLMTWTNSLGPGDNLVTTETGKGGFWTNNATVANRQPFLCLPVTGTVSFTNLTFSSSYPYTIFIMGRVRGTPSYERLINLADAPGAYLQITDPNTAKWVGNGSTVSLAITNNLILWEVDANVSFATQNIKTNGVVGATYSGSSGAGAPAGIILGYKRFASPIFDYFEIVIYTNSVSGPNTTLLNSYFTSTYGKP